jgi:hypothetical protein
MPRATVSTESHHYDLKTAPPDGFVELREMSYGEKIQRRSMVSKALMKGGGKGSAKGSFEAEMDFMNEQSMFFSFQHSIVDHNLEDEQGNKLNLSTAAGIQSLAPRIGEEIDQLIDKLNNFEAEDEDSPSF